MYAKHINKPGIVYDIGILDYSFRYFNSNNNCSMIRYNYEVYVADKDSNKIIDIIIYKEPWWNYWTAL